QLKFKVQELQHLKMQIHPHFLFNTLNTLYGFALKKSDQTPEMILKLSNLLDYILYQTDKPKVSLIEEVNHIKDYISLEKMRFGDRLKVDFEAPLIPETTHIAPMLLLPFVENSFKHGILKNGQLEIDIRLKLTNHNIDFYIDNTANTDNKDSSGIGLENIKRRLELIYKNEYDLDIKIENEKFVVHLSLKTNQTLER
ncbi:MAG: histidine kinase, partial [Aquaticitalea sp.]